MTTPKIQAPGLEEAWEALAEWKTSAANEGDIVWLSRAIPILSSALTVADDLAGQLATVTAERDATADIARRQDVLLLQQAAEIGKLTTDRDRLQWELWAEMGDPRGAAGEGWEWTGILWALTVGGRCVASARHVRTGEWRASMGAGLGPFRSAFLAMEAVNTARKEGGK